jgi:tricarballylate dehydrogenase
VTANTLEELCAKLDDTDGEAALKELKAYNAAVQTDIPFNPNIKDGRCTKNLKINKSN